MQVHTGLMIMLYNIRYMHAAPANAGGLIGYSFYSAWTPEIPPIQSHGDQEQLSMHCFTNFAYAGNPAYRSIIKSKPSTCTLNDYVMCYVIEGTCSTYNCRRINRLFTL